MNSGRRMSALLTLLATVVAAGGPPAQAQETRASTKKEYSECLDLLLPVRSPGALAQGDLFVAARYVPEDFPGFTITITAESGAPVRAEIRQTKGRGSLGSELDKRLSRGRKQTAREHCVELGTRSWVVTSSQEPRLERLKTRLLALEVPVHFEQLLVLHAPHYEVLVATNSGQIYHRWVGLDRLSYSDRGANPLGVWVYDLAYVLELKLDWRTEKLSGLQRRGTATDEAPDPP